MGRRARPGKIETDAKRPLVRKAPKNEGARVRELTKRLTELLEQQTAASEILRTISSSPTDVQPVLDLIVRSAVRLCDGLFAAAFRFDGDLLHFVAHHDLSPAGLETAQRAFPMRPRRDIAVGRVVLDREVVHFPDVEHAPRQIFQQALGYRSVLAVPMLRDGEPIGAIAVTRGEARPFSEAQIALLQTFAGQAVIAIENVRLLTELQERNRALAEAHSQIAEALDRQTATSEILRVISTSPTDLQPVFDAIVRNAVHLCGASHGGVYRFDGELVHSVAHDGFTPEQLADWRATWPRPATAPSVACQAIRTRSLVRIADIETAAESMNLTPETLASLRARRSRSILAVPMFRGGEVIGGISVAHREVGGFSDRDVELLRTFADQAVIAIENVRLFRELEARNRELTEALEQQTATAEILRVISRSQTDVQPIFDAIVRSASRLCGGEYAIVTRFDGELLHLAAQYNPRPGTADETATFFPQPPRREASPTARALVEAKVVHVPDVATEELGPSLRERHSRIGLQAIVAVPMVHEGRPIGVISVSRGTPGPFSDRQIALLQTFADQAVIAVENTRLYAELEEKSRALEAASQHKSEFLASMSHELRTPLNAIIGFSEVMTERMFGELNEKQDEYMKDIHASGQHLLSLINDILDLSKIEAGRMELEVTDFHLPQAIEDALVLVRERALRRGITLEQSIDPHVGKVQGDERKVKQVLLNLLSNAIKFTPEGGRIETRAVLQDTVVQASVRDTGVGIAPEDQEAVFEEFRQVGMAARKVEGTGLGLALSRKFIELHGGRIWVESQIGVGSTFTFTLPVRRGQEAVPAWVEDVT